jgi:predicted enzyme related to lactoylglutathione lyase
MKIKLTRLYVDDHDKALAFYTGVLGLQKKADFKNSGYRWLTVNSAEDPNGAEIQLELNADPAARAFQQAIFAQNQPAIILHTDDVIAVYERIKEKGGDFIMPPTDVTASTIAQVKDGCGNIIQLVQSKW